MQSWLSFEVDGREVRVERVSTRRTLADYLSASGTRRYASSLVAGNEPWQGGELVGMLDVDAIGKPLYRTVDASLLLVVQAAGRRFVTPAGLCDAGARHPVVEALAAHPLLDCEGDGLANILMCLFEGYHRGSDAFGQPHRLSEQLDACLGRSTDYPRLRQAALELFGNAKGSRDAAASWTDALADPPEVAPEMHYLDPDQRRFYRPQTIVEAFKLQRQYANAIWISGGTELGEKAWHGDADWEVIISLDGIAEMQSIFESGDDEIEIGAAASLSLIGQSLGDEFPLLRKMLRRFGSRAVRNRATLGGHLASASPSGDLWPVLMAMDARARLVSIDSERDVPVASFAEGPGRTTLRPGEVIRSVVAPRATPAALERKGVRRRLSEAYKAAQRRNLSRAIVASAFSIDLDQSGIISKAILAYSGIADRPLRARETEKQLLGKAWNERTVIGVLQGLDEEMQVTRDDALASKAYRRQLVITLFQKFFYQYPTPDSPGRELGVVGDILSGKVEAPIPVETAPEAKPAAEAKPEADAKPAVTAKPEAEAKPAAAAKPEAEAKPAAAAKPEAEAKPAAAAKPEVEAKPAAAAKPEAEAKPAAAAKPEVEAKPAATAKPAAEAKPAAAAKPEAGAKPAAEAQADAKAEPKAKSAAPDNPATEVKAVVKSKPAAAAKPVIKAKRTTEPKPAPVVKRTAEAKSAPTVKRSSADKAEPQPKPAGDGEAQPAAESDPKPKDEGTK